MVTRRFPAWQKVVAFAPLLLLLVSLPGQVLLRCRLDGILRSACCCAHRNEVPGQTPVARAQDCCDRQVTASTRGPADTNRHSAPDIASLALTLIADVAPPSSGSDRSPANPRSHGPPRGGPPVILLKHAFLI